MGIWDSKCVWDIIWVQDTIAFCDIYRKRDSKWLFYSFGIWNNKCVWDIRWLQDIVRFWDIYRKMDGK